MRQKQDISIGHLSERDGSSQLSCNENGLFWLKVFDVWSIEPTSFNF